MTLYYIVKPFKIYFEMFHLKYLLLMFTCPVGYTADDPRVLVYPNGAVFKFVLGWGIPVHVPMSVIFAHNIQFQYNPIDNYTEVSELIQNGVTRSLNVTRYHLYSVMENILLSENHHPSCIRRIICEFSSIPIFNSGILGEILQLIFTPERTTDAYGKAWHLGQSQKCHKISCNAVTNLLEFPLRMARLVPKRKKFIKKICN